MDHSHAVTKGIIGFIYTERSRLGLPFWLEVIKEVLVFWEASHDDK